MNLLDRLQLKDKLLLLGLLPAAGLAIILAAYLTSTRLNDMYELLHKTNENLSNSIAQSSVNGVFSGDTEALDALLQKVIREPDLISIKITDKNGTVLSRATNQLASPSALHEHSKTIIQPIKVKSIAETNEVDNLLVAPPVKTSETIGYVTLNLSYAAIQQRQRKILANTIYITLSLFLE